MSNEKMANLSLSSSLPVEVEGIYDCFDSALHAVFKYLGLSYELLFFDSWEFEFDYLGFKSNKNLNGNFDSIKIRRWDYLEQYHGIMFENIGADDSYKIENRVQEQLGLGVPVLATVELYHCPWHHDYYLRSYGLHEVIIVGITSKGYLIKDFQYACNGIEIDFEEFNKSVIRYRFLNKVDKDNHFDWETKINEMSKRLLLENLPEKIIQFAEALEIPDVLKKEVAEFSGPIYSAPLLEKVSYISHSRKKLAAALIYIYETYNIIGMKEAISRLDEIANMWGSTFGMMCKLFFIPENRQGLMLTRICNKIREISGKEENFLKWLESGNYLNYRDNITKNLNKDNDLNIINKIDLKSFYNTNGLCEKISYDCVSVFTSEKRYLYVSSEEFEKMSYVQGIPFVVPELECETDDHISCYGEKILFDPGYYNNIYILCNADLGVQVENLGVLYEDGTIDNVKFAVTTWLNKPKFNEEIALYCKGVARNEIEKTASVYPFDGYIFKKKIEIGNNQRCCGLILPICPNIHIFAITLVG